MRTIVITISIIALSYFGYGQTQITTTGNNLINTGNPYAADIVIGSDANSGIRHNSSMMFWSSGSAARIFNTGDAFNFSVWNTTNPNVALAATVGASSYFQGNVGIGNTNPAYKLDVIGNGNFSAEVGAKSLTVNGISVPGVSSQTNLNAFNNNGIHINGSLPSTAQDAITYTSGGGGGAALAFGRGEAYDTFLAFYTNSSSNHATGGMSEAMRITQSQYVGIGTLNPDAKLAVQGTIHATEVKVDSTVPTPDYVFEKNYHLTTLKDVKAYIDQNHHLPEIPSAIEVAKDGIHLGEMNTKLLKKIEELTLYLIEKDEKQNRQQSIIEQQQRTIEKQQEQLDVIIKQLGIK